MKILFLHGWSSTPGGLKPTYLANHGHEVINPALPDDDFDEAVRIAQAEYDQRHPDVIVGSSRGGAVAMNIDIKDTPLILLCPAWKKWGSTTTVKPNTTILHSRHDDVVPFANSEELIKNSGLPLEALVGIGDDHRLADPESLRFLLEACWDDRYHAIHESSHAATGIHLGLTPKKVAVGSTNLGTLGGVEFCSQAALQRDESRRLLILVAGNVGTRLAGYNNRLVSEKLAQLRCDEEPGYLSDEWIAWDEDYSQQEILAAESKARQILERERPLFMQLTDALLAKGELNKDEVRAIVAGCRKRSRERSPAG